MVKFSSNVLKDSEIPKIINGKHVNINTIQKIYSYLENFTNTDVNENDNDVTAFLKVAIIGIKIGNHTLFTVSFYVINSLKNAIFVIHAGDIRQDYSDLENVFYFTGIGFGYTCQNFIYIDLDLYEDNHLKINRSFFKDFRFWIYTSGYNVRIGCCVLNIIYLSYNFSVL